jgi:predicted TIM-barrel fold metal-dependent hydrolase
MSMSAERLEDLKQSPRSANVTDVEDLCDEVEYLKALHRMESDALHKIKQWAQAYPLDVFPEPDFARVREALEAAGLSLDQVSASNMRHVITQVQSMVDQAMGKTNEL